MRWEEARRIVRIFEREAIYGAHRGSDPTLDEAKLLRLVRISRAFYTAETVVAVILILLMVCPPVLLAGPGELERAVRSSTTLYVMTLFMLVFMMGSTATLALQEFGHLKVLFQLPVGRKGLKKVVAAYLARDLGPVLAVPPLYALIVAERTGFIWSFPLLVLYGYASILLALAASLALSMALWKKRGLTRGLRARFARAFWNGLYVLAMFSVGILYQLYAYAEHVRSVLGRAPGARAPRFLYPLSASELVSCRTPADIALSAIACLAYTCLFYAVFDRMLTAYADRAPYMVHEVELTRERLGKPRVWLPVPRVVMALKDLRVAMREPRTSYIMILPVFSALSFIPLVLTAPSPGELRTALCLMCMTLFLTGCLVSSLVPYQLMEHEGGRLWIPLSCSPKKDVSFGKALAGTLVFCSYALPVAIISSLAAGGAYLIAYAASAILIAFSASLLSSFIMVMGISADTKAVRISLLRALALLALSAALSLPLLVPLFYASPEQVPLVLEAEYPLALAISAVEAVAVSVLNEVAAR